MDKNKDGEKTKDIKLGVYRHYKNQKEYEVLGVALHTETKEDVIVYKAMCDDQKKFVRPKKNFLETVEKDGKKMSRFEFISEAESFENRYKRALADYQNLLKQTAKEREEFIKYANEQVIYDIIPVYDNLRVSMEHVDESASKKGWAEGIKYVIKQFKDILEKMGVEEIEATGKNFDYNTMEALEGKGEKVVKTVKPGYKLHGKVIIPAKVVVG
ncbi:MAG: nucleotide exchange factor GrpE [Candidatus Falkowbacteria bacterium]